LAGWKGPADKMDTVEAKGHTGHSSQVQLPGELKLTSAACAGCRFAREPVRRGRAAKERYVAISLDDDPLGAILEYGHLHKTNDAHGRRAWENENIKGTVGQGPWLGYCIHEHQLVEALGADGTHARVQPIIRRVLIKLRSRTPRTRTRRLSGSRSPPSALISSRPIRRTEYRDGFFIAPDRVATARHIPDQLVDFEIATKNGTVLPPYRRVLVLPSKGTSTPPSSN
jgi:hypothetical protein